MLGTLAGLPPQGGLIHALESNNNDYMTNTMNVWGGRTSKPYNGMREGRRIDLNDMAQN